MFFILIKLGQFLRLLLLFRLRVCTLHRIWVILRQLLLLPHAFLSFSNSFLSFHLVIEVHKLLIRHLLKVLVRSVCEEPLLPRAYPEHRYEIQCQASVAFSQLFAVVLRVVLPTQ